MTPGIDRKTAGLLVFSQVAIVAPLVIAGVAPAKIAQVVGAILLGSAIGLVLGAEAQSRIYHQ